jgi:pimeloyl-ACP methyl ester carboxylesterase
MSRSGKVDVGGGLRLAWREWGEGPIPVLFIHGNLASKDWIELAARWLPSDLRLIGVASRITPTTPWPGTRRTCARRWTGLGSTAAISPPIPPGA